MHRMLKSFCSPTLHFLQGFWRKEWIRVPCAKQRTTRKFHPAFLPPIASSRKLAFCFAVSLAVGGTAFAQKSVSLTRDGKPLAKIYVHPDDVKPVEVVVKKKATTEPNAVSKAIADLNYHLEQMSGTPLEVVEVSEVSKVEKPALVLGRLAAKLGAEPKKTDWQEGFRILTKDDRVLVAGERPEAVPYGIYTFLNQLGCDWLLPGKLGEVIPKMPTVTVPATDVSSSPDFGLRWMWIGGGPKWMTAEVRAEFEQWKVRQRMGYAFEYRHRIQEAHMWQAVIAKYKEEFAKNPEMFALVKNPDGTYERRGPQIETANPKTVELVVRYIKEKFAENNWPKEEKVTLAVGPADGLDYSESPESLAAGVDRMEPVIGSKDVTDLVVKLANDVLDQMGQEYPNLTLGYYVYSVHGEFPARYKPNPRIYPIFAPIAYSRLHSTTDPHSKTRAYYRTIVDQWAALSKEQGNKLMVYEYNWNLADNMLPFTRLRMIAEDLKFYHSVGVFGITMQAIKAWAANAPHDFVYARMLWDVSLDWKKLLREYCGKAFGPAAGPMESYYLRLADTQQEAGQEAGSYFSAPLIFDEAFMKASRADVDAALAAKGLDANQRGRLEGAVFAFEMLELYLNWNSAMNRFDFVKAEEFGKGMQANYDKSLAANNHFTGREAGIYITRLLLNSGREALKYASDPYRIIYRIPDELPTLLDPTNTGARMNIFGPQINDKGWIRTKTYSSTWDAQGLTFYRQGSVWYRTRFEVKDDLKGQGIGLLLSAFEDEALVWVNGKYVGTSGIKFPQPHAFDLTDAIEFGKENLLTIQIRRNSMANELGLGGILRPGFVFAGPRLVSEKPADDGTRTRVLPGGDVEVIKTP